MKEEEGRNIPLIIMLFAGSIVSIACIVYKFSLLQTLCFVLATLVVFYVIGLFVKKIVLTINREAEERAVLLAREEKEARQKQLTESGEVEADAQRQEGSLS